MVNEEAGAESRQMRDLLEDIFKNEPLDPHEAARRAMKPQLRQRFYRDVSVAESPDGTVLQLDGKAVRTPGRRLLAAPTRELGEAIAQEWRAQSDRIDPAAMPLTRLANAIIDGVAQAPEPVAAEVAKYLGSDLLFYRASDPAGLVARQAAAWDPIVAWAAAALGARFVLAEGLTFVTQPEGAVAAARAAIPADPWRLGALNVITTLTGSALIALAVLQGRISADEAWQAAHVDENWNMDQWGRDTSALEQRAKRFEELKAAARVIDMLRESSK
jgi:chaperone required for assembly of F1-ATPase